MKQPCAHSGTAEVATGPQSAVVAASHSVVGEPGFVVVLDAPELSVVVPPDPPVVVQSPPDGGAVAHAQTREVNL